MIIPLFMFRQIIQSEASIQVMWSLSANQRPVLLSVKIDQRPNCSENNFCLEMSGWLRSMSGGKGARKISHGAKKQEMREMWEIVTIRSRATAVFDENFFQKSFQEEFQLEQNENSLILQLINTTVKSPSDFNFDFWHYFVKTKLNWMWQ